MTDSIPNEALLRFRDENARPKVIRVYNSDEGWVNSPINGILTQKVAAELLSRGYTSVEIRWRRSTKQLSLL